MSLTLSPPSELRSWVVLPASKSLSNRALLIAALCQGTADAAAPGSGEGALPLQDRLHNLSDCDDTRVMTEALRHMPPTIDIGAAGTAMRFLTAFLAVTPGEHVITGTERMRHRPIGILVEALRRLGARVEYAGEEGFPPLRIVGEALQGGPLAIAGNVSSQYISALLMIGPVLADGLTLRLEGEVVSRPYIEMTMALMRTFGARAEWADERTIRVDAGGYRPTDYHVENDWSAASYWYEMMLLTPDAGAEVMLPGLFRHSLQGDSRVEELFRPLGVETEHLVLPGGQEAVRLTRTGVRPERYEADLTHQPDLAQTLVAGCALAGIPFRLSGLQSLKIKETDRILALRTELARLGYQLTEEDGSVLSWNGERCQPQPDALIETYEDHRMAMSLAPAAMLTGRLRIHHPEVVSKSYPQFWNHLTAAGFSICSF